MRCELCDDTGWRPIESDGVRRVARCDCQRSRLGFENISRAGIPERYRHCTLENIRAYNRSLLDGVKQAHRFVETFPNPERKGLLLLGLAGVGKTHIAVGLLREVITTVGTPGIFYDTRDLLRTIRNTYDPIVKTSELTVLRPVIETPLLVLDDLGAERATDWVEETMNFIVNSRYNSKRITVFTSNYSDIPDIEEPNSLLGRIGFRMRSRLHEMCSIVEIDAADYRDTDKPLNATDDDLVALWKLKPRKPHVDRPLRQAKAQLREPVRDGRADLKWPGGRAGS
jgi:DNA replication protein DnaC